MSVWSFNPRRIELMRRTDSGSVRGFPHFCFNPRRIELMRRTLITAILALVAAVSIHAASS